MLKHLTIYTIGASLPMIATLEDRLSAMAFQPCGATQPMSRGFVPPRGEDHGAMVEPVGGHWLLALKTEQRILPAAVVKDHVEHLADNIEEQTGRRPKGKAMRELKEQAVQELLPKAFTRHKITRIWLDTKARRIAIDSTNDTACDDIVRLLVEAAGVAMNLAPLDTMIAPDSAMRGWLLEGEAPEPFTIDREAQLKQPDGEKAAVTYRNHALDTDEVRGHITTGKHPVTLAMTYAGRVAFVLTDSLRLKRIQLLDFELENASATSDMPDGFDADLALFAGEVTKLIDALVEVMGGQRLLPIEAADKAAGESEPPPDTFDAATDPLYGQAVAAVREHRRPSISLVQRYLRIGYNRAARLLERMEAEGIVTPMAEDGSRELRAANDGQPPAGAAAA